MKEQEAETGFAENMRGSSRGEFFSGGGSRWKDELGNKFARQIEEDHKFVMEQLGYLQVSTEALRAVETA